MNEPPANQEVWCLACIKHSVHHRLFVVLDMVIKSEKKALCFGMKIHKRNAAEGLGRLTRSVGSGEGSVRETLWCNLEHGGAS